MVQIQKNNNPEIVSSLNCIWMISNLIGIKLCDKQFDCKHCPLDIVLRNFTGAGTKEIKGRFELNDTDFIDRIIKAVTETEHQNNLIYLKNNWLLKHLYANIYYIGINPLVIPLLDNISKLHDYLKKVYYIKGQKILFIEGKWGQMSFAAPINFLLIDKLNWQPEEIAASKWIALIAANQDEVQEAVTSSDQWKIDKAKLTSLLTEYKECCLTIGAQQQGEDGIKLNSLYQLIGSSEYLNILNNLFYE